MASLLLGARGGLSTGGAPPENDDDAEDQEEGQPVLDQQGGPYLAAVSAGGVLGCAWYDRDTDEVRAAVRGCAGGAAQLLQPGC